MGADRIGPYLCLAELGSGGMGTVWRAEGADGAVVALKVVHEHVAATPGFLERFVREGEVGRRVRHENVVATLATGDDAGRHWIALEYVEGQTLRGLADEMGTVPEELCRHVGREVAKGLGALHAAGIVHRDVKPENVLITRDHVVKLMDLGIARGAEDEQRMTATGMFVGSVQYAAPEQFTGGGKGLDARADLHALGVTLYELATGVQPFEGGDVSETLRNVLHVAPRRAGEVNPQLSAFFEEVLRTLLEKEREKRFASAADLLAALEGGEDSAWWQERAKAIRAATRKPLRRIRIPRETALYGREAELAKLRAAFEKAEAGEGAVLLIEGEAGIGKSRLADEFVGGLERDGHDLNFLWGSSPPGGAATASGAFSTAWREHFGNDDSALAAALPEQPLLVPAFAALLRGDAPPQGAEPLTKDSLQTVFVRSAQTLAKERVTIVLVEDLHFAPEEGRALFASLAMATPGHRILLVGTTRPGLDEKWTANLLRVGAEKLVVPRLGPADLVKLLTDSLRSEHLAEALSFRIAMKSDGNPFFAFEIMRGLREGQFITQKDDGTWVSTRVIDEIRIPSSVLDLVSARVADLTEDQRNILDVAACWGFEFDPLVVGDALGLARIPLLRALGQIERQHRLVRSQGRLYAFDHHQVQEALHDALNEYLREEYHAGLASALEAREKAGEKEPGTLDGTLCVDLCEHFLRGAQGVRALRYFESALDHLERGYLNEPAVRLADRALAAPGLIEGVARVPVLLRKANRLSLLGRSEPERAALEEAAALTDETTDVALGARVRSAHAIHLWRIARTADAEAASRDALELARAAGDRDLEAAVTGNLGLVTAALGRLGEAESHHARQLALAQETGDRRGQSLALGNLGLVCDALGRSAEAEAYQERSVALAREAGDLTAEANALGSLGNTYHSMARYAEAEARFEAQLELARRVGHRRGQCYALGSLGIVHRSLGRLATAREHFESCLEIAREVGDLRAQAIARGNVGNVERQLGRFADAEEQYSAQAALAREIGDRQGEAIALVNRGPLRLSLGDRDGARRDLEESLAICRQHAFRYPEGYALTGLAAVAADDGDPAAAERLAEEALALRRGVGQAGGVADSLLQLGELRLRSGNDSGARAALEEALALRRRQGRKLEVAHCLACLARLPGGDAAAAESALADSDDSIDALAIRLHIWHATGNRTHLVAARRLLGMHLENSPPERRDAMRRNVRVNREILAACKEQGIE